MKKFTFTLLVFLAFSEFAWAQSPLYPVRYTVATLPAASSLTNKIVSVTDSLTQGSCTVGGGTFTSPCRSDGTNWVPWGDGITSGTSLVTDVSGTSPINSTHGTSPAISIDTASGSQAGALTATDWNTFNNKLGSSAIGSTVQAWDGDLDAIAGISATLGLLKKTAANTWTLDTNTYLTANQTITLSGDVSGSGATAITTTIGAGKVTNAMLVNSTISGIALGSNLANHTVGTGLSGSTYNGSAAQSWTVDQTFSPTWTGPHIFNAASKPVVVKATSSGASGISLNGRASDNVGFFEFFQNNGTTLEGSVYGIPGRVTFTDASSVDVLSVTAGKVGIGTTSPGRPLTVNAASGSGGAISVNGRASDDVGYLEFYRNNASTLEGSIYGITGRVTVTDATGADVLSVTAGKVGILTASPGQALDVNGSTRHRDAAFFGTSDEQGTITWGGSAFQLFGNTGNALSLGSNGAAGKVVIGANGGLTIAAPTSAALALAATGLANSYTASLTGSSTSGQSFGAIIDAGTNSSDVAFRVRSVTGTDYLFIRGDGNVQVNQALTSDNFASQTTGWGIGADGSADFRYLFTDELRAKLFTADREAVLAGSQRVTKSFSTISQTFTCPAAGATSTLWVNDAPTFGDAAVFVSGDAIVIHNMTRTVFGPFTIADCVGVVSSYADGTGGNAGQQSWTFTRNSGGSAGGMTASTAVPVNELAQDLGTTGNGYVETSAVDGAAGVNAPYTQVVTWATAPVAANLSVRTRMGNLLGVTGSAEYGLVAGTYSASNGNFFRASDSNFDLHGITAKWWDSTTNVVTIAPGSGSPYIGIGNPAPSSCCTTAGIFLGWDHSATKAKASFYSDANNYLKFDGTNLTWKGAHSALDASGNLTATNVDLTGTITADGGNIGGFSIGPDYITDTANSFGLASTVTGGDDPRLYAGSSFGARATAPFRVTEGGALFASSATITGSITSTSGSVGGFSLGSDYIRDAGNSFGLASTVSGSDDVRFWAGDTFANRATAPFNVTEAGVVTMTSGAIAGKLLMSGSSSAIAIGVTPPTSASAGTGIWLDRTGLYGLLSNTVQAKVDATTGAIKAGGGTVTLDNAGVTLVKSGSDASALYLNYTSSTLSGRLGAIADNNVVLRSYGSSQSVYPQVSLEVFDYAETGFYSGRFTLGMRDIGGTVSDARLYAPSAAPVFSGDANPDGAGQQSTFIGLVVGADAAPNAMLDVRGTAAITGNLNGLSGVFSSTVQLSADGDALRLGTLASSQYYTVGRETSTGLLVFSGLQQTFSGIDFRIFPTGGSVATSALKINLQDGGVTVGSPTGGDKGAGTINASAVYDDNVLLTDWLLTPGGKPDVLAPYRRLFALDETRRVVENEHRLPWMPKPFEFETERKVGGMITRLWQGQEQQQAYINQLEDRILKLEQQLKGKQ